MISWFNLANFVGFQLLWFSLIVFGNQALYLFLILIGLHLYFLKRPLKELTLILIVASLGALADSVLAIFGVFIFTPIAHILPIPLWLLALWVAFAATLNHSLSYLQQRPFIAAVVGAIGGPMSYFAGTQLGGIRFGLDSGVTWFILASLWLVLLPVICATASTFAGDKS
jgi:hypothetical protein